MTLVPTLYDFQISLSQVDRAIDQPQLGFKLPRHPSETMQRLWLRVLAYCWLWEERMTFGPGLGEPEAPDLECRDYTGLVTRWVRVGKADPVKVQRAVDQNPHAKVSVLFESAKRLEAFVAEAREAKATRVSRPGQESQPPAAHPMGARPGQSCTSRGCAACPPTGRTARAAPVSAPPRHLRSSPRPQHGLYPAYTRQAQHRPHSHGGGVLRRLGGVADRRLAVDREVLALGRRECAGRPSQIARVALELTGDAAQHYRHEETKQATADGFREKQNPVAPCWRHGVRSSQ